MEIIGKLKKPKPRVREGMGQAAAGILPQTLVFCFFVFPMVLLKFLGSALGFFGFLWFCIAFLALFLHAF